MLYKIIDKNFNKVFDKVKIKYYDTRREVRKFNHLAIKE